MADAFVFSGQGSQYVGMGAALLDSHPVAREVFSEADDALGESLTDLVLQGPMEKLTLTRNAQPAILALSIAMLRVLEDLGGRFSPVAAAGHSLGEYSALVAAGALEFSDAVRVVRARGDAMQAAVAEGVGGMAAIMGLDAETIEKICSESSQGEVVEIAGHNSPVQTVVAGHLGALDRVIAAAGESGARRSALLQVSAPFHCSLLEPAGQELQGVLEDVEISSPRFPVIQNADAQSHEDPDAIRAALVAQVSRPVRWVGCVEGMRSLGADRFLEYGPGRTLSGLIKKMDRSLQTVALDRTGALEALV
ncbi:MAG: ACP S-malonyltransferase [Myxococcota bacterium]|nr:ACP S-malonyltransferase [Myxococcota bacterium]